MRTHRTKWLAGLLLTTVLTSPAMAQPALIQFEGGGICNASAAVALDERTVIVGDDRDNVLPVFDLATSRAVGEGVTFGKKGQADVEGGAVLQGRIVWITSHGRNSSGENKANRQNLFTSHRLDASGAVPALQPPFTGLLGAIQDKARDGDPIFVRLTKAIGGKETNADFAPKKGGFNIEGLAVTTGLEGPSTPQGLLVGMRNPRTDDGRAILFEVVNAGALLDGENEPVKFGRTYTLDLGGRRVRDIAYAPVAQAYLIIGGTVDDETEKPSDGGADFAVFRWDGRPDSRPVRLTLFGDIRPQDKFHAEAIVPLLDRDGSGALKPSRRVLLLSDDGKLPIGDKACEDKPPQERVFRGMIGVLE